MAARLVGIGEQLRGQLGLRGRIVAAERLHVTLRLADREFEGPLPSARVAMLRAALDDTQWPTHVPVRFDRVASFGHGRSRPLVLTTHDALPELHALERQIAQRLGAAGFTAADDYGFRPHLTLIRSTSAVEMQAIEPVEWVAEGFDLVHSHIGLGRYDRLASWSLPG